MDTVAAKQATIRILSLGKLYKHNPRRGIDYLLIDGGNVRCLSQLKILQELMHRVETDTGKTILPCEFFHSMTGVGAGG